MSEMVQEENFIVKAYEICELIEKNAEKYVKSAKEKEKDVEELWKASNNKKQKKQLELAHNYRIMAFVSTAFMITSAACGVGQVSMNLYNPTDANKLLADLIKSLGETGTSFGSKIADNISGSATTAQNSQIEELTQNSNKLWEMERAKREKEKSDQDNLLSTVRRDIGEVISKAGSLYNKGN